MSMVTDKMNANKPQTDSKGPKPGAVNNGNNLDVDAKKEEPSFFGSFFSSAKNAPKKKGVAVMENVSSTILVILSQHVSTFCSLPPSSDLKPPSTTVR